MFPITMSFTVSTPAELDRLLAAVKGNPVSALSGNQATPEGGSKPAAPAEKEGAGTQHTAAAGGAQQTKDANSDAPLDYEKDVRPRFLALATAAGKGREAQLRVLELAGCAKKLTEVADTQEGLRKALAAVAQVEAE